MLIYPQLSTGALSQFPVVRQHRMRTLVNTAADGTAIKMADAGAEAIEWQLQYSALSDSDLAALQAFFAAAAGTLNPFTFVDPTANLLGWSDALSNAVWSAGPMLTLTGGAGDAAGGNNGWQVVNQGAAAQSVTQTAPAPGGYVYTFSVYAQAAAPTAVTLTIGNSQLAQSVEANWQRLAWSATSDPTASAVTFGIELEAGATVNLYGPQAEPQATPSMYKASTTGGCYQNARLGDDALSFTTLAVNRHAATVRIFYASNL